MITVRRCSLVGSVCRANHIVLAVMTHVIEARTQSQRYTMNTMDMFLTPRPSDLETFVLSSQPADVTRKEGEAFTFSCVVQGSGEYEYAWYKSPSLTKGSHSKSVSL